MTPSSEFSNILHRAQVLGQAIAACGGVLCLIAYFRVPQLFYSAYLTAFAYWLGITLGCLLISIVHGLTGGAWGRSIRRVTEAGYETLPMFAVLFVPIWLGVASIYEWADPEFVQRHESLVRKAGYLNIVGFRWRAIGYFVVWIVITCVLNLFSPNEERGEDTPRIRRLQVASGLSMIFYGFTFTLAAVDWIMSLEPEWYSTMYGLISVAGQAVSGLSFALIVIAALAAFEPWSQIVTPTRLNDLGNLLLAAVMFWAYCSFFQYLVVWCGNLPEENVWYLHRSQRGWQYVALTLMIFHFAVPFFLLLSRRIKQGKSSLWRIAALLLVMRYVDLYWLVVPGFQRGSQELNGLTFHAFDLVALVTIGGAWISVFLWRLSIRVGLPMYDPDFAENVDGSP